MKKYYIVLLVLVAGACGSKKSSTPHREEMGSKGIVKYFSGDTSRFKAEFEKASKLLSEYKYEEALALYQTLAAGSDQPAMAYTGIGTCHLLKQDAQKALAAYEKVLSLDPESYAALLGIGSACLSLKRYDQAIEYYHLAIENDASMPDSYWGLAIAYDSKNIGDSAMVNAKKFMDMEPNSNYVYDMQQIIKKYNK